MDLVMMLGDLSWGGTWYSRHHLVRGLAQRHRVFVVEQATCWRQVVANPTAALQAAVVNRDSHHVLRYRPAGWLPDIGRPSGMRRALYLLRARQLERYLARAKAQRPIHYVWNPGFREAVSLMRPSRYVYHCYDKYDCYEGVCARQTRSNETWLVQNASLCVAASASLASYVRSLGARHVLELRHGVDVDLFRPGLGAVHEFASIPGPRLGIAARMNEVLDVDTLSQIAAARPDWSIVLVGGEYFTSESKRARFEQLCQLPNVYHVGERPRAEIPQWLNGFDVGMICYDRSTWGPYNQPIKMYEYLACGLPVVATNIRAARELGTIIRCCETNADWIPQIEQALQDRTPESVARRVAFANANRWEQRVSVLENALQEL